MIKQNKKLLLIINLLLIVLFAASCSQKSKTDISDSQESVSNIANTPTVAPTETPTVAPVVQVDERKMPDWASTAVIYEVNVRQYTKEGTFKAFSEHLDRLKNMGVTTLWFMPIYPISEVNRLGTLGSYYAIRDYKSVNPEFGDLNDFKDLVNKAHDMGFTVILDWVGNHTGWDHTWISEHPDWYTQDGNGNIISPAGTGWTDVADLNYDNKEMRSAMIDAMDFWVQEVDVDGFRCDYAGGVPQDFWEEARQTISQNKELYMLAEDNTNKNFLKTAFDSNYNWSLYDCLVQVAHGNKKASNVKSYIRESMNMPTGAFPLNFLDNHDKNSWEGTMSSIFGDDAIPALTTLIFTMPGSPLIYSGEEAGLDKKLKFFDKDEINWDSLPYEKLITSLSNIKKSNPALYSGTAGAQAEFIDAQDYILAFERIKDSKKITIVINLSKKDQSDTVDYNIGKNATVLIHGVGKDEMTSEATAMTQDDLSKLSNLKPWEFYVISSDAE